MRKHFIGGFLTGIIFLISATNSQAAVKEVPLLTTQKLLTQRTPICQASLDESLYCSGDKKCRLALIESAYAFNDEAQASVSAATSSLVTPMSEKKEISPVQTTISIEDVTITPAPVETTLTPEPQTPVASAPAAQIELNPDIILQLINDYRTRIGLPALEKDPQLCSLASSRTPEIYAEIYVNHNMHSGLYNRNLPYWITENLISQNSEPAAINWWINSPIHRAAIQGNYKYSCGACQGNVCSQLFTNYQSK